MFGVFFFYCFVEAKVQKQTIIIMNYLCKIQISFVETINFVCMILQKKKSL